MRARLLIEYVKDKPEPECSGLFISWEIALQFPMKQKPSGQDAHAAPEEVWLLRQPRGSARVPPAELFVLAKETSFPLQQNAPRGCKAPVALVMHRPK